MTVAGAVKSGSEFHITMTVRATMRATTASSSAGAMTRVGMASRMLEPGLTFTSKRTPSTSLRTPIQRAVNELAMTWGTKESTAHDRLNNGHSVYRMVADANEALLRQGLTEEVSSRMAVIDSSLMGERVPTVKDADHAEDVADAEEDVAEAEFRRNPSPETWEKYRPHVCRSMYRLQDVIASHDEEYR
jgi:uncharacterized membrane protein